MCTLTVPNRLDLVLLLAGLLFLPTAVMGQPTSDKKRELIRHIRQTNQQIKHFRERREQELKAKEKTLRSLREQRQKQAEKLVSLEKELRSLHQSIETLEKKNKDLTRTRDNLNETLRRAGDLRRVMSGRLRNWIRSAPPSQHRAEQRKKLQSSSKKHPDKTSPAASLRPAVDALLSLLREGRDVQVFSGSVRTPEGYQRKATILRVGRVLTAYRTRNGSYGIRVDGKGGYRWTSDLTKTEIERIDYAMEKRSSAASRSDPARIVAMLPIDPTQEISASDRSGSRTLIKRLMAGGPVMIPLGLIALISLFLILERTWTLSGARGNVDRLLADVHEAVSERRFQDAEAICDRRNGAVAAVLKSLLTARSASVDVMQDRVEETILQQRPRLERFLPTLSVLAAVAPLLGLLGTVTGIIETFDVIALFGAGNQQLMAGGISEALMTTATGLAIAIPVLLCHGYFRSRVDGIIGDMERTAASVYNLLQASDTPVPPSSSGEESGGSNEDSSSGSDSS